MKKFKLCYDKITFFLSSVSGFDNSAVELVTKESNSLLFLYQGLLSEGQFQNFLVYQTRTN